ncbi:MAG: alanine racemase [Alphaproteobacteria bacterium]|nr:alanine racemase [Alphaproteobacteria bacterium]
MKKVTDNLATGILTIDLNAIAQNYLSIQNYCYNLDEKAQISAVIKANGYGLGMSQVAESLYGAGCRLFYVATLDEAIALRAQYDDVEIFVLDGLFMGAENIYQQHNLIPCLASVAQVMAWAEFGNLPCVLHFDTGINRLGMALNDFKNIAAEIIDGLNVHHIMSHFASADWPNDKQNSSQVAEFELISDHLPQLTRSFGNSAGIALKQLQNINVKSQNILRPGVALWGVKTFENYPIDLKPVVALSARVLQISALETGDMVGYGHLFSAKQVMRTAIIAAGYADGLPRSLSSRSGQDGYFYFNGKKLPILGRVSMDMIVVSIDALADGEMNEGDFVEVIGAHISLDMLATWSGSIAYEILTSLGKRFLRKYINGKS